MKNRVWLGILVVITFALGGCADNRMIRNDKDDIATASLVFGYVDMQDAPVNLDWMGLKQVLPKPTNPIGTRPSTKGCSGAPISRRALIK